MPNENKPSYTGFLEFIENQPKERQIDHTNAWCNCAVGDYLTDIGGAENDQAAAEKFNDKHFVTNNSVFYFWLGEAGGGEAGGHGEANTYGDVQVYLEQFD